MGFGAETGMKFFYRHEFFLLVNLQPLCYHGFVTEIERDSGKECLPCRITDNIETK